MIWMIGGGPRSHQICQYLNSLKKAYKLTTVTDYKRDMPLSYTSKALSKPLNEEEIRAFIKKENIKYVIDHSYGEDTLFSKRLMQVCDEEAVIYIRYEEMHFIDEVSSLYEGAQIITHIAELEKLEDRPFIFVDVNRKVQKELAHFKYCIYKEERIINEEGLKQIFREHVVKEVIVTECETLPIYVLVCKAMQIPLIIIKRSKMQYRNKCHSLESLKGYLQ